MIAPRGCWMGGRYVSPAGMLMSIVCIATSLSAVDFRQIKSAETLGIGQYVDLRDLAACNGESENGKWPPVRAACQDSDIAVHEDDLIGQADSRERSRLRGDGLRPSHDSRCDRKRTAIGAQHDVRIEHGDQPLEVAVAGGSEKRIDDAPLLVQVRG